MREVPEALVLGVTLAEPSRHPSSHHLTGVFWREQVLRQELSSIQPRSRQPVRRSLPQHSQREECEALKTCKAGRHAKASCQRREIAAFIRSRTASVEPPSCRCRCRRPPSRR